MKIIILNFQLKNKRNLDRKTVNLLRNKEISAIINKLYLLIIKIFVNNH